jgi:hypothetical protein
MRQDIGNGFCTARDRERRCADSEDCAECESARAPSAVAREVAEAADAANL